MMPIANLVTPAFRALSAHLGQDPLQVQGPGGNTSIKTNEIMYIKASGTELAEAETQDIFVAVDRQLALAEAHEKAGDGSCKTTVLDPNHGLRPSIETSFHAAIEYRVVAHTHSIATLAHAISPQGRQALLEKLNGLPFVMVPYAKPGLPLTREILARITPQTQIIILQNHGLICAADSVEEVASLIQQVETRLALELTPDLAPDLACDLAAAPPLTPAPQGFEWSDYGWLAQDQQAFEWATSGSYYPDHVVFLGPSLPVQNHQGKPPVILQKGKGVLIKTDATPSQKAMLRCLSDVLGRIQKGWEIEAIGEKAEAELLDWDAEKYRQALAARQ